MIKKPVAVGLKVCEKAVVEKTTGNVTLVNCLRRLRFKRFPAQAPSLFAFVSVTDALGSCQLKVAITRLATMNEIDAKKWKADFRESLQEHWFLVPFGPVDFPVGGRYEVAFFADGELITRSVIDVSGEKQ